MVEPVCKEKIGRAVQVFRQVASVGKASADPETVITAAYQGQLSCLFLAQGEHLWGSFDSKTQTVRIHDLPQMGDEDLSNFAAVHCLRHGHPVYVLS
jgi:putative methionine-R-sulfoxide reductase with GAF domain